jgi:hypothetical protein
LKARKYILLYKYIKTDCNKESPTDGKGYSPNKFQTNSRISVLSAFKVYPKNKDKI